jgi:hypothetical protein
MYTLSDAIEMGSAHELILSLIKEVFVNDDVEPNTCWYAEYFDE